MHLISLAYQCYPLGLPTFSRLSTDGLLYQVLNIFYTQRCAFYVDMKECKHKHNIMPARGGRFGSFCSFSVNLTFLQLKSLNVSPQRGRKRGSFKKAHRPHWTVYHHLKHINADFLSMTFPDSLILPRVWSSYHGLFPSRTCFKLMQRTSGHSQETAAVPRLTSPSPWSPSSTWQCAYFLWGTHSSFCSGFRLPSHHCMSSSRNQPTSAPTHPPNKQQQKQTTTQLTGALICQESPN